MASRDANQPRAVGVFLPGLSVVERDLVVIYQHCPSTVLHRRNASGQIFTIMLLLGAEVITVFIAVHRSFKPRIEAEDAQNLRYSDNGDHSRIVAYIRLTYCAKSAGVRSMDSTQGTTPGVVLVKDSFF